MLSVHDLDGHRTRYTRKLTGTRIRHYGNRQLRCSARHDPIVLEYEGAAATMQRPTDTLDRDISGRALDASAGGQHLAPTGRFEIAVKLFVDRHPAEACIRGFILERLWGQLDIK